MAAIATNVNKPADIRPTESPKFSRPTARPPRMTVKLSHERNVLSLAKKTFGSTLVGRAIRLPVSTGVSFIVNGTPTLRGASLRYTLRGLEKRSRRHILLPLSTKLRNRSVILDFTALRLRFPPPSNCFGVCAKVFDLVTAGLLLVDRRILLPLACSSSSIPLPYRVCPLVRSSQLAQNS